MALKRAGLTEDDVAQRIEDRAAARKVCAHCMSRAPSFHACARMSCT